MTALRVDVLLLLLLLLFWGVFLVLFLCCFCFCFACLFLGVFDIYIYQFLRRLHLFFSSSFPFFACLSQV